MIQQHTQSADTGTQGADAIYLTDEQKKLTDKQAQYRLFSIRAKEAIKAYKAAVAELKQAETFARGVPIWDITNQLIATPAHERLGISSTLSKPDNPPSLFIWGLVCFISVLISVTLLAKLRQHSRVRHYIRIKKLRLRHVVVLSCWFITGSVFLSLLLTAENTDVTHSIFQLSKLLFLYLSAVMAILFFFKIKRVRTACYWYLLDIKFFRRFGLAFVSFYALRSLGHLVIKQFGTNALLWSLSQSIFLFAMLTAEIYFIYYFCRAHHHLPLIKHHARLIFRVSVVLLVAFELLDILGYHVLSMRLATSGFTTFIIVFITAILNQGINTLYHAITHHEPTKSKFIHYFGYKHDQIFTEFLILKTTIQIAVIAISALMILNAWDFSAYYIKTLYTQFLYGIHIANVTLYPTRIVVGIIVYCLLFLFFKSISTSITRHQQFEGEEETQVAIASIFTYAGFTLALIVGLFISGVNFTGLAIVAGALSVGIGLGLQSIVNNFVSGLILLIEKPIKPGDRINIDGIDGFVKKIRVRSTHLITPSYEDIIVPNSDLITKRVTNYVYTNKQVAIHCDLLIPFGRDTQLVRTLLLQVAHSHDEVIKTGRNKPMVLFRSFGEKGLSFQLCCLIKDVNKNLMVQSDLNFAIDQLFRENKL